MITDAACVNTNVHYAENAESIRRAKLLCKKCPSANACLTTALQNREPYGIWGGLTAHERSKL